MRIGGLSFWMKRRVGLQLRSAGTGCKCMSSFNERGNACIKWIDILCFILYIRMEERRQFTVSSCILVVRAFLSKVSRTLFALKNRYNI